MKKLFILFMLFPFILFSQQLNHTWGSTTAGAAYTKTGSINIDSSSTTSIVFDLQDWYPLDMLPVASDDSVIILNSTRLNYGTFWYKVDVESATDSSSICIQAFPGFMDYYPGSGERIATANIDYSTTATTLQDSSSFTTNDIQWTAVNVYLSDTEGKILPPEFIKLTVKWATASNDSIDFYHDFVYISSKESDQSVRTTTNPANAKKAMETLH